MNSEKSPLLSPLAIVLLVAGLAFVAWRNWPAPAPDPIDNSDATRILMVGNSYTKYNDLCRLLGDLSRTAGKKAFVVEHTILGSKLSQHLPKIERKKLLIEQEWDFVVLQEQSLIPAIPKYRNENMVPLVKQFDEKIRAADAETVLFMTWGRKEGIEKFDPELADFDSMQNRLTSAFQELGEQLGVRVAPVGVIWQAVHKDRPDLELWTKDGSHPGPIGSYLAACVFYVHIFGESPEGVPYYGDISEADAKYLQRMAWETEPG